MTALRTGLFAASLIAVTAAAACRSYDNGGASEPAAMAGAARIANEAPWNVEQIRGWYHGQQGSRLIPLSWLRALRQPGGAGAFLDPAFLATFRLLADETRTGALPVGFAPDTSDSRKLTKTNLEWYAGQPPDETWAGLTCAACHTGEIHYRDQRYRIIGAPALFDYQSFIEALDRSLQETLGDAEAGGARWNGFARGVLCIRKDGVEDCSRDTPANRDSLRGALAKLVAWEGQVEAINRTSLRYGFGRVDAFGHIFNKIALFNGAARPTPNPANAPVSYPFLWDIYRQDKLQWNGIVSKQVIGSIDFGALGRNSGEVLGVFGDVAIDGASPTGFASSVNVTNLERLERLLETLRPPRWPEAFGSPGDAVRGRAVFADAGCASCHKPQPGTGNYKVQMQRQIRGNANNTDPWMACNALRYASDTGKLAGVRESILIGDRLPAGEAPLAAQLTTVVKGVMLRQGKDVVVQMGRVYLSLGGLPTTGEEVPGRSVIDDCFDADSELFAYKARPLDGIWATAPFLHNGSVPNLYQLLLPPDARVKTFHTGTHEYDPENGGYRSDAGAPGNSFLFDTALPGNSNAGHDYGVGRLSDADRRALLAYLKTL